MKILTKKILYLNIFAKGYAPNWLEEVFVDSGIKNAVPGTYVLPWIMVKRLLEVFVKKNCKTQIKKNSELKKYLKEKVISCMSNGKGMIIVLIVGLVKKISCKNESILS